MQYYKHKRLRRPFTMDDETLLVCHSEWAPFRCATLEILQHHLMAHINLEYNDDTTFTQPRSDYPQFAACRIISSARGLLFKFMVMPIFSAHRNHQGHHPSAQWSMVFGQTPAIILANVFAVPSKSHKLWQLLYWGWMHAGGTQIGGHHKSCVSELMQNIRQNMPEFIVKYCIVTKINSNFSVKIILHIINLHNPRPMKSNVIASGACERLTIDVIVQLAPCLLWQQTNGAAHREKKTHTDGHTRWLTRLGSQSLSIYMQIWAI